VRLIHTADWHLGSTWAGHSRAAEHDVFLAWLIDLVETTAPDALLIAGDIFETGNPSAQAQAQWFTFLAELRRRAPFVDVVAIGGNHDAAARLDAPASLYGALGFHVQGSVDPDRALVPLRSGGDVVGVALALPFLRSADLPPLPLTAVGSVGASAIALGTAALYERAAVDAAARFPGLPVVALGHARVQGGQLSPDSERPVHGGHHAVPVAAFGLGDHQPRYTALGHLHLAQSLGRDDVRYSGSPLPLSMAERAYAHQVLVVDDTPTGVLVTPHLCPRPVPLWRLAEGDGQGLTFDDALDRLRALDAPEAPAGFAPFLEVRVRLDAPVPDLRAQLDRALEGKDVRLTAIKRDAPGDGVALADAVAPQALRDVSPEQVFVRLHERTYGQGPDDDLLGLFRALLDDELREQASTSAERP
jgi:exonuclease SbcD